MQAVIITAYKSKSQLLDLIHFFKSGFKIYIHLDNKSKLKPSDFDFQNVTVLKKYNVYWGSLNHLKAILDLLTLATLEDDIKYIHIISESDIPLKPLSEFKKFENDKKIYMDCMPIDKINNSKIEKRYSQGVISSNLNNKNKFIRVCNYVYGHTHKKNNKIGEFNNIYKGLVWCSFPKNVGKYVISYSIKNSFLDKLKHVLIPEEFFFQTILSNSKYYSEIKNDNLRFDKWKKQNGSIPAILDMSNIDELYRSNCYFARKIDPVISKELIKEVTRKRDELR